MSASANDHTSATSPLQVTHDATAPSLNSHKSHLPSSDDSADLTARYRPFRVTAEQAPGDWVKDVDCSGTTQLLQSLPHITRDNPLKFLILYGSLRPQSYNKKLSFEIARLLEHIGGTDLVDVRAFDPAGLPLKDEASVDHPKVQELRALSMWSDGHVWISPEQHGTLSGVMKNLIDWIPLELGSVRPTQGKTCLIGQTNGGSQSFNTVNTLRVLARWMRMICIVNQSSIPQGWKEFDEPHGRLKPSSYRGRVVDVTEEMLKFTALLRPHSAMLVDRYSEREERKLKGRLMSQEEKVAEKDRLSDEQKKQTEEALAKLQSITPPTSNSAH